MSVSTCGQRLLPFLLLLSLSLLPLACDSATDEDDAAARAEQSGQAIRSVLTEAALLNQMMQYVYMSCMSNGFTGALYGEALTDETTGSACFETFFTLAAEIAELGDLDAALDSLGAVEPPSGGSPVAVFVILKGWDFYQALKSTKADIRNRFLQIVEELTPEARTEIYETVYGFKLSEEEKARVTSESVFYSRVESGALDYAMPQIHNLCYNFVHDYTDVTLRLKGRPIDLFVKKGTELVVKGAQFNNSANMAVLSAPLSGKIREHVDVKQTATNYLNMFRNTTGAMQAGQTVVDYVQSRLPQVLPEIEAAQVATSAQGLTSVVDALAVQSFMETLPPQEVSTELFKLGYSQIKVSIPPGDSDRTGSGDPQQGLVVVTDEILFSGARVRVGGMDDVNGPIIVEPGTYNVTASLGGELQNVGDVAALPGQVTDVQMTPERWKEITKHFGVSNPEPEEDGDETDPDFVCEGSCSPGEDPDVCTDSETLCTCQSGAYSAKECGSVCLGEYTNGLSDGCRNTDQGGDCQCRPQTPEEACSGLCTANSVNRCILYHPDMLCRCGEDGSPRQPMTCDEYCLTAYGKTTSGAICKPDQYQDVDASCLCDAAANPCSGLCEAGEENACIPPEGGGKWFFICVCEQAGSPRTAMSCDDYCLATTGEIPGGAICSNNRCACAPSP